jgi:antitoxin MazE
MAVTLQKWGNSVGVRLPKPMLEQVGLKEGAQVDVLVEGDHLVIRRERLKLADLLAPCKPENRPDPIDFGPPVGREVSRRCVANPPLAYGQLAMLESARHRFPHQFSI